MERTSGNKSVNLYLKQNKMIGKQRENTEHVELTAGGPSPVARFENGAVFKPDNIVENSTGKMKKVQSIYLCFK